MDCYLHIGQTKTGSSFIQSSFSCTDLSEYDLLYPISEEIGKKARSGEITSGNYWPRPGALAEITEAARRSDTEKLLISSEALFGVLASSGTKFLNRIQQLLPGCRIKVLCFLRDPVGHAVSAYQQKIKRGGFSGTLEDSFQNYAVPLQTTQALTALKAAGAEVTLFNYSKHKNNLLERTEGWLGLPGGTLQKPAKERVNRSLTNTELELQRNFNRFLGSDARKLVSDPVCNELPDVKSERPPVSRMALSGFLDRMEREMGSETYRALIPDSEIPIVGSLSDHIESFPDTDSAMQYQLTAEQIAVIAAAISKLIKSGPVETT